MTDEEQKLLRRLAAGELEGLVGNVLTTDGGASVWSCIEDGIPIQYKQGPGSKYFNGKENEHVPGALRKRKTWKSDDEKLEFLQKFGWLIKDDEVQAYSAKYKP